MSKCHLVLGADNVHKEAIVELFAHELISAAVSADHVTHDAISALQMIGHGVVQPLPSLVPLHIHHIAHLFAHNTSVEVFDVEVVRLAARLVHREGQVAVITRQFHRVNANVLARCYECVLIEHYLRVRQ